MKIAIIAKLTVKAEKIQEFEAAFEEFEKTVNTQENGNIFFHLHRSRTNKNAYTVIEQYADQVAVDFHENTDYYKAIPETFGEFMAGPPDIEYLDSVY